MPGAGGRGFEFGAGARGERLDMRRDQRTFHIDGRVEDVEFDRASEGGERLPEDRRGEARVDEHAARGADAALLRGEGASVCYNTVT